MTEFTINIKVTPVQIQLDVTPAMAALLTALLQGQGVAEQPKAETYGGQDNSCTTSGIAIPKTEDAVPQTIEQPKAEAEKQPEAKTEEESSAPCTDKKKAKALTAEDVRAAMHRTRQRIEGEDYKDNTESELYQKYHKELTRQFKNIAATLGADKPSALPEENRESFIEQCDLLAVQENGEVGLDLPF